MPISKTDSILFNTIVDGVILIDQKGIITRYNPACGKIFGYDPDDVIGQNVKMLMPNPYRDSHDQFVQNYLQTGDAQIIGVGREVQGLRKDGTVFDMELAVGASQDEEGQPFFVGIVRDISERRRSEVRLRDSESQFRAMFDTAVDGIIIIDEAGTIELFNPSCEEIFGYRAREAIGQNVRLLMPSPYQEQHDGYITNFLTTGEKKIIGVGREVRGRRKDGSTFPMDLSVGFSNQGSRRLFVGVVRDITARHNMETDLAHQAEQLSGALEREKRVNRVQSEFLSMATHEFRTPLSIIDASAQRLKRITNSTDPDLDDIERRISSIRQNVVRMTGLIDSILTLSKSEAESFTLSLSRFEMTRLCNDIAMRYNDLAGWPRVDLQSTSPTVFVRADRELMVQVLDNVVGNAGKYTPIEAKIRIMIEESENDITVAVQDHGAGFAEPDLDRLFDRYYRGDQTSGTAGTGLGLYMCRRFVELHSGSIDAENTDAGGRVTIRLPKVAEPSP